MDDVALGERARLSLSIVHVGARQTFSFSSLLTEVAPSLFVLLISCVCVHTFITASAVASVKSWTFQFFFSLKEDICMPAYSC